ncbi:hypothetical protein Syun_023963 [Stephania yunnanensis]|uniref:Uncharacterized protein n=1 Tax=Stephania yunnanensis TaxID=152371 RepID=A0AAP0I2L8_9MAGN
MEKLGFSEEGESRLPSPKLREKKIRPNREGRNEEDGVAQPGPGGAIFSH